MALVDTLKIVVEPLRLLIDRNSKRIDKIEPEIDDTIDMLIELDALPAVSDAEGYIITDENGAILMT